MSGAPIGQAWSDTEILHGLDLRDHEGMTYGQIAKRIGRTRNSVIACLRGVDAQADKHDPTRCQDGTMPRGWWRR